LAQANLLQLVSHHGTDSGRDLGLLCRNKMLRRVGIEVVKVNGTFSRFLQLFQSLLDKFGLSSARPSNSFFTD